MDDNSFGARLAAARRAAGYNQTEVAKYINFKDSHASSLFIMEN